MRTKHIVTSLKEIPDTFVFEHFLNLPVKLIGQEECIKSVFTAEKTPSMTIFCDKNSQRYFFKCFSSGKGGTAIDLVQHLNPEWTRGKVMDAVKRAYETHLAGNGGNFERDLKVFNKFKVDGHELRTWNSTDRAYFGKYHIQSKTLDWLNAAPLAWFTMSKEENGKPKQIRLSRELCYGFFDKKGLLYKIYQPGNKPKFIKVHKHVQGDDQLTYRAENLLITKALKDIAGLTELRIPNWEIIAPDSENSLLDAKYVADKKIRFKVIKSLFDGDEAGIKATQTYKEVYDIPGVEFEMSEKDPTDNMAKYGPQKVREVLIKNL